MNKTSVGNCNCCGRSIKMVDMGIIKLCYDCLVIASYGCDNCGNEQIIWISPNKNLALCKNCIKEAEDTAYA